MCYSCEIKYIFKTSIYISKSTSFKWVKTKHEKILIVNLFKFQIRFSCHKWAHFLWCLPQIGILYIPHVIFDILLIAKEQKLRYLFFLGTFTGTCWLICLLLIFIHLQMLSWRGLEINFLHSDYLLCPQGV